MNHRRPKRHLSTSPGLAPLTSPNLFMIGSAAAPGSMLCFSTKKNDHLMPEHDDQDLGVANFFRQIHLTCLPSPKKMMVNGWFGAVQVQKKPRAALLSVGLGHLISRSFFCQLRHAKSDYVQDTSSGFQYSIIYIYIIFIRYTQEYMYVYALQQHCHVRFALGNLSSAVWSPRLQPW
jgi:hypothetical protein